MTANEIREKYLKFFEDRGHARIKPSPLVLENDPTTLFTSSGMQQLVPYLKGSPHPKGKTLVDSQPCLRLQDIEEVGDTSHTTFFEMLGNWSLGDYFKKEQLPWIWEFFTKELGLPAERLWVSVFEGLPAQAGTAGVPRDSESIEIWKSLGVPQVRIRPYGVDKNWWSRTGTPKEMPTGEIGGPDSEVFYEFDIPHNPKFGKECHPNCQCGRFLEIGNSVFIQYVKKETGSLEELPQKNVDFGGGLERIEAAINNDADVFKIDLLWPIIKKTETFSGKNYSGNEKPMRIIADHLRASAALIRDRVVPSNKEQGYVLRRLVRRAFRYGMMLGVEEPFLGKISESEQAAGVLEEEEKRFQATVFRGLKEIEKFKELDGEKAFFLYETYGFPLELTEEIATERGQKIDKEKFKKEFEKHQELSRKSSSEMFKVLK